MSTHIKPRLNTKTHKHQSPYRVQLPHYQKEILYYLLLSFFFSFEWLWGAAGAAAPLFLLVLSRGKAIGLAGEEARQIYGGGGDLWGRNTVMGEWLSTVSYWHLTKCPKQNEFTSLFLNHQAATALTPILTAITRSPISQGPEKFTVTSTFQWAQVSTSFTFNGAGAAVEEG